MRIKFPGKTDDEAEDILDKLMADWKFHKPRVASYWLVKLDSIKRRKVSLWIAPFTSKSMVVERLSLWLSL